ncbi:hypothetical protein Dimus_030833 [Dionaea muscipula]
MDLGESWKDHESEAGKGTAGVTSTSTMSQFMYGFHRSEEGAGNLISEFIFEEQRENNAVCINFVLPDDLLGQVLGHLPITSIVRAGSVCKKWNDMVHSGEFIKISGVTSQKPWYFMFTRSNKPLGHVFDPTLVKWYNFRIPYVETPDCPMASSSGLLCFTPNSSMRDLYVCNPITKNCRKLEVPRSLEYPHYSALTISLNAISSIYTVAILRSVQYPGEMLIWDVAIDVYRSDKLAWESPIMVTLHGWRAGYDCVICDGTLYFVVYPSGIVEFARSHCGLLTYHLDSQSLNADVQDNLIPAPCAMTCMRLMNLREELVMVGGIEKPGRQGIIKGIGIWVLEGRKWVEVSRMPNKFFRGCGEFDDVFASSGFDEVIFIQSYGSPALLMFNMNSKQWKWSQKCPVSKKCSLELFSGICFEPRLDILP